MQTVACRQRSVPPVEQEVPAVEHAARRRRGAEVRHHLLDERQGTEPLVQIEPAVPLHTVGLGLVPVTVEPVEDVAGFMGEIQVQAFERFHVVGAEILVAVLAQRLERHPV